MDQVSEIGFSGIRNQPKNGFKAKVEQGFSSFPTQTYGIFDDFLKFVSALSVHCILKIHQIWQQFGKK